MDKFINNRTSQAVIVISSSASGMCEKTRGLTLVVYRYESEIEGEDYGNTFVMEHREFYKKHSKK